MTHNGRETVPDDWWLTVAKRTLVESGLGDSKRPIAAIEAHRLSVRKGRIADSCCRSTEWPEMFPSGRGTFAASRVG